MSRLMGRSAPYLAKKPLFDFANLTQHALDHTVTQVKKRCVGLSFKKVLGEYVMSVDQTYRVSDGDHPYSEIQKSSDGINWESAALLDKNEVVLDITSSSSRALLVSGGSGSPAQIRTSTDLTTWSTGYDIDTNENLSLCAYGNGVFVVVGKESVNNNIVIYTSSTGLAGSWTKQTAAFSGSAYSLSPRKALSYNASLGFCFGVNRAPAPYITSYVWTSPDGVTWTSHALPAGATYITDVVTNGTTIATWHSPGVSTEKYSLSTDGGTTWSHPSYFNDLYWETPSEYETGLSGFAGGYFLAGGINNSLHVSTEGENWEEYQLPELFDSLASANKAVTIQAVGGDENIILFEVCNLLTYTNADVRSKIYATGKSQDPALVYTWDALASGGANPKTWDDLNSTTWQETES